MIGERRRVVRGQDRGFVGHVQSEDFGLLLRGPESPCPHCQGTGTTPQYAWALREATEAAEPDLFEEATVTEGDAE